MKVRALVIAGLVGCMMATTGCRNKLAMQQLTPQQEQWAQQMDGYHWKWRLPYQAPVREVGSGQASLDYAPASQPGRPPAAAGGGGVMLPDLMPLPGLGVERGDAGMGDGFVIVPFTDSARPAAGDQTYKVAKGDTLSKIAVKFYGHSNAWKRIYDANRDKLPNPDRLVVGTVLTIPPGQ